MNPFIHLSDYHVIVCAGQTCRYAVLPIHLSDYHVIACTEQTCKYAVLPIHVDSHLSSPHHNYNTEQRKQVIQVIQKIEGLIQDARGFKAFAFPDPSSLAIPRLMTAKANGLQCKLCRYMICH